MTTYVHHLPSHLTDLRPELSCIMFIPFRHSFSDLSIGERQPGIDKKPRVAAPAYEVHVHDKNSQPGYVGRYVEHAVGLVAIHYEVTNMHLRSDL